MSAQAWRKIAMKFPGKCVVCNQEIKVGAPVLWLKGEGVKHESCGAETKEIPCAVCGRGAGCSACELRDDCDLERVSPMCICKACSEEDALAKYLAAVGKKFTILDRSKKAGQATLM